MRIAVLGSNKGWHFEDLQRAAGKLGHELATISFRRLSSFLQTSEATLDGNDANLAEFEAVLVRGVPPGSLEQIVFRMDALHQLVDAEICVINPPHAIECCVDKFLATVRLQQAGLPVPRTLVCENAELAMAGFEKLGSDVVVKPLFGSLGRGILRVSEAELAYRTFRTLARTDCVLYLQEFIEHPGWDLRAVVLDGEVLASMKRVANGDWRANIAQGAQAENTQLSSEETGLAVRAAAAVHAEFCGVDILPGPDGQRFVIEANSVPGWKAISQVTRTDVAIALLQYLEQKP